MVNAVNMLQQSLSITKKNRKRPQKNLKLININKCNWKGISCLSRKTEWGNYEKNNLTSFLNVLYVKKIKIYPAYISKHNSKRTNVKT